MAESFGKDKSSGIGGGAKVAHQADKNAAIWRRVGPRAGFFSSLGLLLAIVSVVLVARQQRDVPARCPEGRTALGHRCCWISEKLEQGRCTGRVDDCRAPYDQVHGACTFVNRRVFIRGGAVHIAPSDWQAEGVVEERLLSVESFSIDAVEARDQHAPEPDLPQVNVSPEQAEHECKQRGGRLPTRDEWIFAATGVEGRRYAWGQTGLVCRRAVYGLIAGPCAFVTDAGPDAVASRPSGASPDGVFDLIGNVAEWARTSDHGYVAMGGSFRSQLASELKVWSYEVPDGPNAHVGFRCVYLPKAAP